MTLDASETLLALTENNDLAPKATSALGSDSGLGSGSDNAGAYSRATSPDFLPDDIDTSV